MTRLPPALHRGLTVVGIGATVAFAHVTFAAAAPSTPLRTMTVAQAVVQPTSSVAGKPVLADNCYFERAEVKVPNGKTVVRLVEECD